MTPNRMRGQVSALYLFFITLAGIGLGPTIVGLFTQDVYGGDAAVRYAIATLVAITAPASGLLLCRACRDHRPDGARASPPGRTVTRRA